MNNKEYQKKWYKLNKKKKDIQSKNYYINNPWVRVYSDIKTRCENPNNKAYKWYGGRGIECNITVEELKELWFRDNAYEMDKPSIDRIDNDGHYEYDNCQFIELKINCCKDILTPILQYDKQGNFIKEWASINEAGRALKINTSSISAVCKHKKYYNTAGGFIWRYKNEH